MCAYLGVICIGHLLFGVQYIHYLNCRLAICFELLRICICDLLFAIFATGILGEKTTGAPEADSVATKMPIDGETVKAISGV